MSAIQDNGYYKYCNDDDRKGIHALLTAAIEAGCSVSVNDGEEATLIESTDINEIKSHLVTTGQDFLTISNGDEKGVFTLIYNNGSENDPLVVISDHSDNGLCNWVYERVRSRLDR